MRSTLALLREHSGPVIIDYPNEAPAAAAGEDAWACPVSFPPPQPTSEAELLQRRLETEVQLLAPWYEEGRRQRGRTAVRNSGKGPDAIDELIAVLANYAVDGSADVPAGFAHPLPSLLRYIADDLKAFYFEAATAQPGRAAPSPAQLNDWLFLQTTLGETLYHVRERLLASEDTSLAPNDRTSWVLVPVVMRAKLHDKMRRPVRA